MRTPWQLLLVAAGPAPAVRLAVSGCLERPALLAGNLTAGYSWHCPAAWARAAGHPLPGPTLATGVAGHPQQHLAATWRGELTGRWQSVCAGLPGPPAAHGTATTVPRQRSGRGPHQSLCWLAT